MAKNKTHPPPTCRDNLRPVDKVFLHKAMFELGILPIEDPTFDMRVPLKQLSPEEARVLKRKFRKLWRKCMKAQVSSAFRKANSPRSSIEMKLGVGKHVPSKAERLARKRMVYELIWDRVIVPMLIKFENPERSDKKQTPSTEI